MAEKPKITDRIYSIEQCTNDIELMSFVRSNYEDAKQVAQDVVHDEMAYCRSIVNTQHGKDYWQNGDDEEMYDEIGLQDTRRFRSAACNQKNKQTARKQTRQKPKIYFRIKDIDSTNEMIMRKLEQFGGLDGYVETLQRVYDDWWERNNITSTSYKLVKQAHDEGTSIAASYWDSNRRNGRGDLVWSQIRPENFYPEPGYESIDQLNYFYYERIITMRSAVAEYGEKALTAAKDNIEEKKQGLYIGEKESAESTVNKITVVDAFYKDNKCTYMDASGEIITKKQYEKIMETLDLYEQEQGMRPEGIEPTKIEHYPHGRMITFCGNTKLEEKPNPFGFIPFGKYIANEQAYSFWGEPTTRDLAPQQENFDKIIQGVISNFYANGLPKLFIQDGMIEEEQLQEVVKQYFNIKSNKPLNSAMHYQQGMNVAADGLNLAGLIRTLIEDISGIHQASEGRGTSQKSGRQTIALQMQTHEYLEQPARNWEAFLKEEAKKHITLLHKYLDEGARYNYQNPNTGERIIGSLPMALSEIDATIEVVVSPGSSIPEDKESKANRALALHGADPAVFDSSWLVKELGMENDKIIMQNLQMVGQMQQLQSMIQTGKIDPQIAPIIQGVMAQLQGQQNPQQMAGQRDVQSVRQQMGGR